MNEPIKTENTDIMNAYQQSESILTDVQNIIETSQRQAYHAVDTILSQRNWLIGYRIAEEELKSENRAEYGTKKKPMRRHGASVLCSATSAAYKDRERGLFY